MRLSFDLVCFWLLPVALGIPFFSTPVVKVKQGKLRGVRSLNGVNQYFGIPYATSERFQPPKAPKKWKGTLNAVKRFTTCPQKFSFLTVTTEDCLELDVYTPQQVNPAEKLPVWVVIHGGAYYIGSKALIGPELITRQNVIAVAINYRLGVFGFLCGNVTANLGLKDQTAALRWVNKNIAAFGGDPDNVSLAGISAGATSASMHMLSEHSKGLFHKVILMSGTAFVPWAFNVDHMKTTLKDANKIALARNEEEVYNIFATYPTQQIVRATEDTVYNPQSYKYSPCVDSNFTDPFFHDTPYEIIKSGRFNKVPVLVGIMNAEGLFFYDAEPEESFAKWNTHLIDRLPSVFSWCSEVDRANIAHKIKSHYFGNRSIDTDSTEDFVRYFSDYIGSGTFDAFVDLLLEHSDKPVYKSVFSYEGDANLGQLMQKGIYVRGATHNDDVPYIFKPMGLSFVWTRKDRLFCHRYTTMLGNFIKYGDPTPRRSALLPTPWPACTAAASYVMRLDRSLRVTTGPHQEDRFFLDLLCTYGLQGYVPCESKQQCNLQIP